MKERPKFKQPQIQIPRGVLQRVDRRVAFQRQRSKQRQRFTQSKGFVQRQRFKQRQRYTQRQRFKQRQRQRQIRIPRRVLQRVDRSVAFLPSINQVPIMCVVHFIGGFSICGPERILDDDP